MSTPHLIEQALSPSLSAVQRKDAESFAAIGPRLGGPVLSLFDQAMRREFPPLDLGGIAAYVQALKDHDWSFERSDDHRVWGNGINARSRLNEMRKKLDRDGALWNAHAPADYRVRPLDDLSRAVDQRRGSL